MVTPAEALQIPQALALAQDPENRHQQQIPGRDAYAPPHAGIRDRLDVANQVEIGYGRNGLGHKKDVTQPTSTHTCRPGKGPCNRLEISPGVPRVHSWF